MPSPNPETLSPRHSIVDRDSRGAALLCGTAALILISTGAGMLEGHAIYQSWRDLAGFADFASYHSDYGRALLPFLPLPLVLATLGNIWLLRRRPDSVPRGLVLATLLGQVVVLLVTATLALPIQIQLGTPGNSPEEIVALVDRLIVVGYLRELPGLAVAAGFIVMLYLAVRGRAR